MKITCLFVRTSPSRRPSVVFAETNRNNLARVRPAALGIAVISVLLPSWSAQAQGAPYFTNGVTDQGLAATANWAGGGGPFLLQRKVNVTDPTWVNLLTTSNSGAMIAKDAASSFLRLQSQATNTVIPFGVYLDGASEVPVVGNSSATGIGTLSLEGSNLNYYISFSGLSAPATAAHIHGAATPTNSTGVLIGFSPPAATAGTMSGTLQLTADQIAIIVNGSAYVNIHTTNHPGGEIRSQITPLHIPITLNGAAEVPVVNTPATGTGSLTLIGSQLFYNISYTGLAGNATLSHIHGPASTTNFASVLVGLASPTGTSGTISGWVSLTPANLNYLLSGLTYVNIHSTANPGGEIRGQIWPIQLGVTLSGAAVSPPSGSSGSGSGFMTILNSVLTYNVSFTNLLSNATLAHIHGPASRTQSAGVLIGFSGVPSATSGTISGTATLTALNLFYLMTGQTYVNIHTSTFSDGEIRGQIEPAN